jgi:hypothetical protein
MVPETILQAFGGSHWTQPLHCWPLLGLVWYATVEGSALALCALARDAATAAAPVPAMMARPAFKAVRRVETLSSNFIIALPDGDQVYLDENGQIATFLSRQKNIGR